MFHNTSAEHAGTYRFAADVAACLETEYQIPVFWVEYTTFEHQLKNGGFDRRPHIRLVKRVPVEGDPLGYRSNGEVYEHYLSKTKVLPNRHRRNCTYNLKAKNGNVFLGFWLAGILSLPAVGPADGVSRMSDDHYVHRYLQRKNATATYDEHLARSRFMLDQPPSRPAQTFGDYTAVELPLPLWSEFYRNGMFGVPPAEYVQLFGIRADEKPRVDRIIDRTFRAAGAGSVKCQIKTQPPGQIPYFPLYDWGLTKADIMAMCKDLPVADLDIPKHAGNCVFCPLKSTSQLAVAAENTAPPLTAPDSIGWWIEMETKYSRDTISKKTGKPMRFGFWGNDSMTFQRLKDKQHDKLFLSDISCDCTD